MSAVLSLLADDVTYENLGSSTVLRGRAAVGRFYLEALAMLPEDATFVLEGAGGQGTDPWVGDTTGPVLQAGMAWWVRLKSLNGFAWSNPFHTHRSGRRNIWLCVPRLQDVTATTRLPVAVSKHADPPPPPAAASVPRGPW